MYGSRSLASLTDTVGIGNAVRADANDTENLLTVESNAYCACAGGVTVACSGACSGGSPRHYLVVTVRSEHETILPYPFANSSFTLEGTATMRAQ